MAEAKKASFKFIKFSVPKFSYNKTKKEKTELNLLFDPKGEYIKESGIYSLNLNLRGIESDDKTQILEVDAIANFQLSNVKDIEDIPEYFYANSIAIMFPYVRSFISTVTLQANTGIIMLDTLNLTGLKEKLKENTVLLNS